MLEHFYNGFIKRAQDHGFTVVEADRLYKTAADSGLPKYSNPQEAIRHARETPGMSEFVEQHAFNPATPQGAINTAPVNVRSIIDPRDTTGIVPGHQQSPGSRGFAAEHEAFLKRYYGDNFSEAVRRNNGYPSFSGGEAVKDHAAQAEFGRQQRLLREAGYPTNFNVDSRNPATGRQHSYGVAVSPNVFDYGGRPMLSSVITDKDSGKMFGQHWYQSSGRGSDPRTRDMMVPTNGVYTPHFDASRTPDALALERFGGHIPAAHTRDWRSPHQGSWIGKFFLDPDKNAYQTHDKLNLPFAQATAGKGIKEYFRNMNLGRGWRGVAGPIAVGIAASAIANGTANAATSELPGNGPSGNLPQNSPNQTNSPMPPKQFPNVGTPGAGLSNGVDPVIGNNSRSAPTKTDSSAPPRLPMSDGPRLTVPNVGKK